MTKVLVDDFTPKGRPGEQTELCGVALGLANISNIPVIRIKNIFTGSG